jgi:hypothetical protein
MVDELEKLSQGLTSFANDGVNSLKNDSTVKSYQENGFIVSPIPNADGNGLPSFKIKSKRTGYKKRNLISWFVPEVGVIKMYINPNSLRYSYGKIINQERTKGGYNFQYWGEELPKISIGGTTGSSGIEGINVLYEIYRAEQYAFDGIGLTLAAENYTKNQSGLISSAIKNEIATTIIDGTLGANNSFNSLGSKNIPTMAEFAFGIEMFYQGWVHRGYFSGMTVTEKEVGLFEYNMDFVSLQRRGYRLNNMPWQRSPNHGYSDNSNDSGVPLSYANLSKK